MNSAIHKSAILLVIIGMLLSACGTNLWGTVDPTPSITFSPTLAGVTDPPPTPANLSPTQPNAISTQAVPSLTPTPTIQASSSGTPRPSIIYYSQSGDQIKVVALHFDVTVGEISSTGTIPANGLLNPGTTLIIPNHLSQTPTTPSTQIIPDCEMVYSPCGQSFDIEGYVSSAGGKLSTFREPRGNSIINGAEIIRLMAFGSSISPRILLALIQYYTGWVQGPPNPGVDPTYPLGYQDPLNPGLYQQLRLLVRDLLAGYYDWRDGKLTSLTFPDGFTLRLAPDQNAGSVALEYMFSRRIDYAEWQQAIDPQSGFPALYATMFGNPWDRADEYGPLFPPEMTQPTFSLPFDVGAQWTLTGGPHAAWEQETPLAAMDFAPAMNQPGCFESLAWVDAIASGRIVRSGDGYVILDLDGDGFEQTGWVVLYQHIATKDRIPVGKWVNAGDHIGHPSCEGGTATGTHVHIARKYNGEWVDAGDPLPFVMSGWTAHAGSAPYQGTLTRGDQVVTVSQVSLGTSKIIRLPGE